MAERVGLATNPKKPLNIKNLCCLGAQTFDTVNDTSVFNPRRKHLKKS